MKVTIITVVLNSQAYIEDCILSVLGQTYKDLEYIIVDGGSTDGTFNVISKYSARIFKCISEPDQGIYDAMNKGIRLATGDIIGILNSDDYYVNRNVIATVVNEFITKGVDSIFADLVYVNPRNPDRITRYYKSSNFHPGKFSWGWMPAHPTFFVRRIYYEKYGLFKVDYKIAADFELLLRFLGKHRISYSYIPKILIKMRTGGKSTRNLMSNWQLNREILKACRENGIRTNMLKVVSKYFLKSFELISKPKEPLKG